MDLPVWQALYEELGPRGFVPIAVAFDSAGERAAGQWIRAANPTYPCLIDRQHMVAELYDMVNVPSAVWIDEQGIIVRPSEAAGVCDAFRRMDRKALTMPPDVMAELQAHRSAYVDAIRDWVANGAASRFALSADEVVRRMSTPGDDHVRAAANFRMGEYLHQKGHAECARRYFDEAVRLRPESWNFRRQAWALEEPSKAAGPEFWSAVDELDERSYYPPLKDI
jgi:hypothetical protein